MTIERWGKMVNEWHDEVGAVHLLKDDNSPACGASYYASSGALDPRSVHDASKCGNCKRIAAKLTKG